MNQVKGRERSQAAESVQALTTVDWVVADLTVHREPLLTLNTEYMRWIYAEMDRHFEMDFATVVGVSADDHAQGMLDKVHGLLADQGVGHLLKVGHDWAAMGALRTLSPGVGEIKRVYVRPAFRGLGLGGQLVQRLMADAVVMGHERVYLDSACFMQAAHALYQRLGFVDTAPYVGVEVPEAFHARWRFMCWLPGNTPESPQ